MHKTEQYIKYTYWSNDYNSKSIALVLTLKEVYEEMRWTLLDNINI